MYSWPFIGVITLIYNYHSGHLVGIHHYGNLPEFMHSCLVVEPQIFGNVPQIGEQIQHVKNHHLDRLRAKMGQVENGERKYVKRFFGTIPASNKG